MGICKANSRRMIILLHYLVWVELPLVKVAKYGMIALYRVMNMIPISATLSCEFFSFLSYMRHLKASSKYIYHQFWTLTNIISFFGSQWLMVSHQARGTATQGELQRNQHVFAISLPFWERTRCYIVEVVQPFCKWLFRIGQVRIC